MKKALLTLVVFSYLFNSTDCKSQTMSIAYGGSFAGPYIDSYYNLNKLDAGIFAGFNFYNLAAYYGVKSRFIIKELSPNINKIVQNSNAPDSLKLYSKLLIYADAQLGLYDSELIFGGGAGFEWNHEGVKVFGKGKKKSGYFMELNFGRIPSFQSTLPFGFTAGFRRYIGKF